MLTAVGTVPVPNGPGATARTAEFDLALKSTPIDIALLQPATTQVTKLAGQFSADVRVKGTLEAPRFEGLVETTNGGFSVVATGVTYTNAIARLLFEGDRVFVDRFELSDDDADRLVAIGELGIVQRGIGAMNLQISSSQFKVLDNEFGDMEIDSDVRVTGEVATPTVTGEIVTRPGRLEVDQILEQLSRSPYRTEATTATVLEGSTPASESALTPFGDNPRAGLYDTATIDVRLRLPDDLLLRGRDMHASFSRIGLGDMNITVGGELQIRKAPAGQPDVIGTVTVVRGYYDFQGRRFEVLRDSQIRFQGTRPVDPALQVDAQRIISGVTAMVNIRGTARQPQVRLSSQPPLDEADVLSLIVFNRADQSAGRRRAAESRGARGRPRRRISRHAARKFDRPDARSRLVRDSRHGRRNRAALHRRRTAAGVEAVRVLQAGIRLGRLRSAFARVPHQRAASRCEHSDAGQPAIASHPAHRQDRPRSDLHPQLLNPKPERVLLGFMTGGRVFSQFDAPNPRISVGPEVSAAAETARPLLQMRTGA